MAAVTLLANFVVGGLECGTDTSYCAEGGALERWEGRVFDGNGRAAAAVVEVDFGSVYSNGPDVRIKTDPSGRFCFAWPGERLVADINATELGTAGEPDARFTAAYLADDRRRAIVVMRRGGVTGAPLSGVAVSGQFVRGDESARCPASAAQPPWYEVDDLTSNWRPRLVMALAALALVLLAASVGFRTHRPAPRILAAGASTAAAAVAAFFLVWSPVL